jgi:hypothetical protein
MTLQRQSQNISTVYIKFMLKLIIVEMEDVGIFSVYLTIYILEPWTMMMAFYSRTDIYFSSLHWHLEETKALQDSQTAG